MRVNVNTTNQFTRFAWCGSDIAPERMLAGGGILDLSQFYTPDSQLVTIVGAALAAAVSVTVGPISNPIPNGTTVHLGTNKFFTVNQVGGIPANAANQAVTVLAIPTALAGGETGRYAGAGIYKKYVLGGQFVGRTYAERDANTGFGPADFTTPDDEIYIIAFDNDEIDLRNEVDLILPDRTFVLYENFLPGPINGAVAGWAGFDATAKAKIRSLWGTTVAEQ